MMSIHRRFPRWCENTLAVMLLFGVAWWQGSIRLPTPTCTAENASGYSGEKMLDFATRRRLLFNVSEEEAFCWLEQSALVGHAESMTVMGIVLEDGVSVPRDLPGAIRWYEQAIDHHDNVAAYRIGKLYNDGALVPKDNAKAMQYFKLAARLGNSRMITRLRKAGIDWDEPGPDDLPMPPRHSERLISG